MDEASRAFLLRLLETAGPAGFEVEAARVWRAEAETFADEVFVDTNGNSYARLKGDGRCVIIEGHIDEIGLMISHIDDEDFCWLAPIGGWDTPVLIGQHVRILTAGGPVHGVIGRTAFQMLAPEAREKAPALSSLWVDIGARDGASARRRARVGDPLVIESPACIYGDGDDLLAGRGLDNRIGAWAALEALRILAAGTRPAADVWAVATVQEEIGLWGAMTSAWRLHPDVALAIDVRHATDYPDADRKRFGPCVLGAGPGLARGSQIDEGVRGALAAAAEAAGIPWQPLALGGSLPDDAGAIAHVHGGIPAALVSIPDRCMHSPSETVSLTDLANVARLCAEYVVNSAQ